MSEAERRLIGEALRAGRLVLAEGERSVALGGSADGATIVIGDGNVVHSGPPQPDLPTLLNRGIQELRAKCYEKAAKTLKEVVNLDPSIRTANFYLALALLKGKRPKILTRNDIQEIDELLSTALISNPADSIFHWFRAIVRDDYYTGNGLICPPPSVQEIVSTAVSGNNNISDLRTLLNALPMRNNRLYMALTKSVD